MAKAITSTEVMKKSFLPVVLAIVIAILAFVVNNYERNMEKALIIEENLAGSGTVAGEETVSSSIDSN